jgi:hypothetical protein
MGMKPEFAALLLFAMAGLVGPAIIVVAMILRHQQRTLIYKERIAAIEKGIEPPQLPSDRRSSGPSEPWTPQEHLRRGLIWLFAGLAIIAALGALSSTANRPITTEEKIRIANNARSAGATDEEIKRLWEDNSTRPSGLPVGAAALGLVPAAVGAAYLVFYGLERKKLKA